MGSNTVRRVHAGRRFLWVAMGAILAVAPAFAKPNFTGDWKLNTAKSDFGPAPAPQSRTDKITHQDPNLKVVTKTVGQQGEFTIELNYMTDGKESTNDIRGNAAKSVAKWDGDALLITTKANLGGNDITFNDRWTLSEDGKTLTINRHLVVPQGEFDQKLVMEKV